MHGCKSASATNAVVARQHCRQHAKSGKVSKHNFWEQIRRQTTAKQNIFEGANFMYYAYSQCQTTNYIQQNSNTQQQQQLQKHSMTQDRRRHHVRPEHVDRAVTWA